MVIWYTQNKISEPLGIAYGTVYTYVCKFKLFPFCLICSKYDPSC